MVQESLRRPGGGRPNGSPSATGLTGCADCSASRWLPNEVLGNPEIAPSGRAKPSQERISSASLKIRFLAFVTGEVPQARPIRLVRGRSRPRHAPLSRAAFPSARALPLVANRIRRGAHE